MVYPSHLFAPIFKGAFNAYKIVPDNRRRSASQAHIQAMIEGRVVRVNETSSWAEKDQIQVFLDASARHGGVNRDRQSPYAAGNAADSDTEILGKQTPTSGSELEAILYGLSADAVQGQNNATIGIDVEDLSSLNIDNQIFLERNFTALSEHIVTMHPTGEPRTLGSGQQKRLYPNACRRLHEEQAQV